MRTLIRLTCQAFLAICAILLAMVAYEYSRLPDVSRLKSINPKTTALMALRDREQRRLGKPVKRQQIWVPYGAVSEHLKKAILLGEDAAFFSHGGVDFHEMKESLLRVAQEGEFARGGSTITMQLARNLYLDPGKNIRRKLREIAIAWKLERALSKRRIFELYLNVVEWGPGIYGAEAAARHYYRKSATAIDPVEAATLAALLPSPLSPKEKTLVLRRNVILKRMARTGVLAEEELEPALKSPLFRRETLWERLRRIFQ